MSILGHRLKLNLVRHLRESCPRPFYPCFSIFFSTFFRDFRFLPPSFNPAINEVDWVKDFAPKKIPAVIGDDVSKDLISNPTPPLKSLGSHSCLSIISRPRRRRWKISKCPSLDDEDAWSLCSDQIELSSHLRLLSPFPRGLRYRTWKALINAWSQIKYEFPSGPRNRQITLAPFYGRTKALDDEAIGNWRTMWRLPFVLSLFWLWD